MINLACPSDEQWCRLVDETLEHEPADRLRRHLESCQRCQARLDALDRAGDAVGLLQSAAGLDRRL